MPPAIVRSRTSDEKFMQQDEPEQGTEVPRCVRSEDARPLFFWPPIGEAVVHRAECSALLKTSLTGQQHVQPEPEISQNRDLSGLQPSRYGAGFSGMILASTSETPTRECKSDTRGRRPGLHRNLLMRGDSVT